MNSFRTRCKYIRVSSSPASLLATVLKDKSKVSEGEASRWCTQVLAGLAALHNSNVVHRDIKPENILLDAKGGIKIADFGIAKILGEDVEGAMLLTQSGAKLGTAPYMAPEQIEKPLTVDHRADIYSLGVVFYELLTGELPLGRFGPPSAKTPVDSRVDDVVMRTLEKEREKRFQSAGEMRTQVQNLNADSPPVVANGAAPTTSGARPPAANCAPANA